jgi:hypothetical protein
VDRLMPVMEREFYTLQYHIYAVALHRFLGVRFEGTPTRLISAVSSLVFARHRRRKNGLRYLC